MTSIELTEYTCLVNNAVDHGSFGTGFCVHRDREVSYVVTCAHVVRNAVPKQVKVEGKTVRRIILGEESLDIAVLEVAELEKQPLLQQLGLGQTGRKIQVSGVWKPPSSSKLVKRTLDGQLMKAVLIKSDSESAWVEAWDLRIDDGEYELLPGYSGSPVVDVDTGCVIGIASHKGTQGRGTAIAIQALAEIWKDIPASLLLQKQPLMEEPEMNQFKQVSTRQLLFRHQQLNHQIVVITIEIETLDEKVLGITQDLQKVEQFTSLYRSLEKQKQSHQSELIPLGAEQERLMADLEDITQELKKRGHQLEN